MVLRGKLISQKSSETRYKLASLSALGLFCLSLAGCNSLPKVPLPETGIQVEQRLSEEHEVERSKWLAEKEAQQQEIERLQKLLAEKDAYIRNQARQQDQPKPVQEIAPQAAPAQIKLQRLATRPAAASAIAEAEVFMESLKQSTATNGEEWLQSQAQRFLQAATASFAEDNYAVAMDRAAQAREVVDMVRNNRTRKADHMIVSLQTPIPLRATANSNLRQNPNLKSTVLGVLKKDSILTAEAYQGDWLKVQTAEGDAGWVLNTLVEAHIGKP